MINHRTGTIVVTTGNHGDKSKRFSFEAYRIINGKRNETPEWFLKISFDVLND
jgi:hypothetical protein